MHLNFYLHTIDWLPTMNNDEINTFYFRISSSPSSLPSNFNTVNYIDCLVTFITSLIWNLIGI